MQSTHAQKVKNLLTSSNMILKSYPNTQNNQLTDYGIAGTIIKNKLTDLWRKQFINNGQTTIHEIEPTSIIPHNILDIAGYLNNMVDYVVYDNDKCYNAKTLVKNWFIKNNNTQMADKVDSMTIQMLEFNISKYHMIKQTPDINTRLPQAIRIHRKELIIPLDSNINESKPSFYAICELGFGMFINFNHYIKFINSDPPFGLSTIGKVYRRELTALMNEHMIVESNMACIAFFTDPLESYNNMSDSHIPVVMSTQVSHIAISELVNRQILVNQTIIYFISKTMEFINSIYIPGDKIRFRKLDQAELMHSSSETWIMEIYCGDAWILCIEYNNRGSYDLQIYSAINGNSSSCMAKRLLNSPVQCTKYKPIINTNLIAIRYPNLMKNIIDYFGGLSQIQLADTFDRMNRDAGTFYLCIENTICVLTYDMIRIDKVVNETIYEEYLPHTTTITFNFDRLFNCMIEHNMVESISHGSLSLLLPKCLIPYEIGIATTRDSRYRDLNGCIKGVLNEKGFRYLVNDLDSPVERKYMAFDEIGVLCSIYLNENTLVSKTVVLRGINQRDISDLEIIKLDNLIQSLVTVYNLYNK